MTEKWSRIVNILSFITPEAIDKNKVINLLKCDHTVDEQVLDNLFILEILSTDEYAIQMEKVIKDMELNLSFCKERVHLAKENGINFNPMIYYNWRSPGDVLNG